MNKNIDPVMIVNEEPIIYYFDYVAIVPAVLIVVGYFHLDSVLSKTHPGDSIRHLLPIVSSPLLLLLSVEWLSYLIPLYVPNESRQLFSLVLVSTGNDDEIILRLTTNQMAERMKPIQRYNTHRARVLE